MRTVLRFKDLKDKGVCGSRMSLHRLRKEDSTFPKPIEICGGIGWFEDEIEAWLEKKPRVDRRAPRAGELQAGEVV